MGGKRTGTGKHVRFCAAILTCLLLSQCAALHRSPLVHKLFLQDQPRQHLVRAQELLAQGDYEAALEEDQQALSLSANNPPGDEALYSIALVYAHPGNPKKDYAKSIAAFKRLVKEYPQSSFTEQAKIWVQVMQESENAKRTAISVGQENDRLKRIIEESREVDMEIEEKKREKVR